MHELCVSEVEQARDCPDSKGGGYFGGFIHVNFGDKGAALGFCGDFF